MHTESPDTGLVSRAGGRGGRPHVHDCRVDVCCVRSISPPMIRAIGGRTAPLTPDQRGSASGTSARRMNLRSWAKGRPMKTSPPRSGGDSSPSWPSCPLLGALARAGRVVHRAHREAPETKAECRKTLGKLGLATGQQPQQPCVALSYLYLLSPAPHTSTCLHTSNAHAHDYRAFALPLVPRHP